MNRRKIDREHWIRKEHYNYFSQAPDPYFGITSAVRCNSSYRRSREEGIRFFGLYLHSIMNVINGIPEFRTRVENDVIWDYETLHAAPALFRDNGSFSFSFVEYDQDVNVFAENLENEKQRIRRGSGMGFNENSGRLDVIHYSTVPWIRFSQIKHPWFGPGSDSVPKVVAGKLYEENGDLFLPVSFHAHHGLADGWHAAQFFSRLEEKLS